MRQAFRVRNRVSEIGLLVASSSQSKNGWYLRGVLPEGVMRVQKQEERCLGLAVGFL